MRKLTLVIGPIGSGKSTTIDKAIKTLGLKKKVVHQVAGMYTSDSVDEGHAVSVETIPNVGEMRKILKFYKNVRGNFFYEFQGEKGDVPADLIGLFDSVIVLGR